MRSLARVERFLERLVERPSARVFGTRLQPVQILRRIERELEGGRRRDGDRDIAPDRFDVRLNPLDLAGLGALDVVAEDRASGALAFARSHGLTLLDRPRVSLRADEAVLRGDVDVDATTSRSRAGGGAGVPGSRAAGDGHGMQPGDGDDLGGTRVFQAPVVRTPEAELEIVEPGRAARRVRLDGRAVIIGRASDCGLVLADAHVSREHARIDFRGGVFVLTDLGSTNGTRVNGHRIREVVLGAGDRIELGQTVATVGNPSAPVRA
jgi:FHA domain/Protein of unknown function (DUF3662)